MAEPGSKPVRDRQVLAAAAVIVAVVLGLQLLGILVPPIGDLLGVAPVMVGVLVAVTLVVLVRSVRSGARRP